METITSIDSVVDRFRCDLEVALYERTGWRRVETVQTDWTRAGGGPVTQHRYAVQGVDEGHFELS